MNDVPGPQHHGRMAESNAPQRKRRGPGRPFAKGQSGNPGGRPKELRELQEMARQHVPDAITYAARLVARGLDAMDAVEAPSKFDPESLELLAAVDHKAVMAAATFIADRAGVPKAPIELTGTGGDALEIIVHTVADGAA